MAGKNVDIRLTAEQYEGEAARVLRWLRAVGDTVVRDEPLVEIETDKVTVEIPAPAGGRLTEILRNANDATHTGDVLGRIDIESAGAAPGRIDIERAGAAPAEHRLSPAVRSLLGARKLDAEAITGTGRDGRVTAEDVLRHAASDLRSRQVPHSPMRRRIAQNMSNSVATAPHVTAVFEADMSAVAAHRERHKADFAARGANLTFTAYFIAACVPALRAVPSVNSRFHADSLEIFEDFNIGVATALGEEGLVVPVLRAVQNLSLFEIARALAPLVEDARNGKLPAKALQGGTFTISNHGAGGSLIAAPIIINQPQCAILGVGKLERRPCVVRTGDIESVRIAPKCYVSLTIDHRAIDGFQANQFLSVFVERLQSWPIE